MIKLDRNLTWKSHFKLKLQADAVENSFDLHLQTEINLIDSTEVFAKSTQMSPKAASRKWICFRN